MIRLMLVFHPPELQGGELYFTTPRSPNNFDRARWEGEGKRVLFLAVDPVNQTAEVLKVEA